MTNTDGTTDHEDESVETSGHIDPRPDPGRAFEERLPAWEQRLNVFCENWIFAILIALAIRHFVLEPYRIPSASMEPILYGDPAITEGDFVLVDKVSHRFRDARRWDITVFKYPVPEVDAGGGRPEPARIDAEHRRDSFPFSPLLERYFVKRCLVMPDDVFYFANGDLFLQDESGSFAAVDKPADVQTAMWTTIYRSGAQPGYLPWEGREGAAVEQDGERLRFDCGAGGEAVFTQPINNLYLKEGTAWVRQIDPLVSPVERVEGAVAVSLVAPRFELRNERGEPVSGTIYELDEWRVHRVTSAEADRPREGKILQENHMPEGVGDIRLIFTPAALTDVLALRIREGEENAIEMRLEPAGWSCELDGREVASGAEAPVGRRFSLTLCDDRLTLAVDGVDRFAAPLPLVACDPEVHPLRVAWGGTGSSELAGLTIERDVHYCASGILADQTGAYEQQVLDPMADAARRLVGGGQTELAKFHFRAQREMFLPHLVDERLRAELLDSFQRNRHASRYTAWLRPLAVSPETAIRAPDNGYLMLGDNSPFSYDGRNWGWVPAINIRGRVLCIAWWPSRIGLVH